MKHLFIILSAVILAALACAGCSRSPAKSKIDTTQLESSFASAEPTLKTAVEQAVTDIKAERYEPAVHSLENLLMGKPITDEQAKSVRAVLSQLPAFPRATP